MRMQHWMMTSRWMYNCRGSKHQVCQESMSRKRTILLIQHQWQSQPGRVEVRSWISRLDVQWQALVMISQNWETEIVSSPESVQKNRTCWSLHHCAQLSQSWRPSVSGTQVYRRENRSQTRHRDTLGSSANSSWYNTETDGTSFMSTQVEYLHGRISVFKRYRPSRKPQ